jgi:hypothetical protein
MATNQRLGIISKYTKNLGPLVQGLLSPVTGPGITAFPASSGTSWFPASSAASSAATSAASSAASSALTSPAASWMPSLPLPSLSGLGTTPSSSGGYILQVFFFFFLYGFVLFLLLLLIHFTVSPIFQFVPGGKGIIPISTTNDYTTYWKTGNQPTTHAPDTTSVSDELKSYPFQNQYTVSVDICITDLTGRTGLDRLIFYTATSPWVLGTFSYDATRSLSDNIVSAAPSVCMFCYIADETNDLIVTYLLKKGTTLHRYNSFPIQNIPLYTPFRLTVAYDTQIFTVYFNGVQVSQTTVANTTPRNPEQQLFYSNTKASKCGYVQNMMLWNRSVQYTEIAALPVSLTPIAKFSTTPLPQSTPTNSGSCS